MQAIMETLFDIAYLSTILVLGARMTAGAKGDRQYRLFGLMALLLGAGDAFHLVPRAYALCTTGLADHAAALGFGKAVTSVTMTVFYVLLYYIWRLRYQRHGNRGLDAAVWTLAVLRILLCLMPQNDWLSPDAPLSWAIWRNIPFALLGGLVLVLFYRQAARTNDRGMRFMWLAITLSFGFYIPVVLFSDAFPLVGTLMIPKTMAYVWMVYMGFADMKKGRAAR